MSKIEYSFNISKQNKVRNYKSYSYVLGGYKKKKIKLLGIIFFGKKELETLETIKFFGKKILKKNIKILGRLPIVKELSKNTIQAFTKKIEI